MNTKILLLIIALVLMIPNYTSTGASNHRQSFILENREAAQVPVSDRQTEDKVLDWAIDWSYTSQPDHDHKTHHFSCDRFCRNRKRILMLLGIKFLVLIMHVSSIICATIHLLH